MQTSYPFYLLSEYLARVLPLCIAHVVGRWIATWVYYLSHKERLAVMSNLSMVLGTPRSNKMLSKKALDVYLNFSRNCVDVLYHGMRPAQALTKRVTYEGLEVLDQMLCLGKGLILLSAHIGNWELGAMAISAKKYPLTIIAYQHPDPRVNRMFVMRREHHGIEVSTIGLSVRKCLRALRGNRIVGIIGDRLYSTEGLEVPFFGTKTLMPKGPAHLSKRTGAPIVPCCLIPHETKQEYTMKFLEPLYPENFQDDTYLKETTGVLEKMIKKYPTQWFAFEDMWRDI
jgi:lauroyl/myristoyl acyltransferase